MKDFIRINKLDNVAVALNPLTRDQKLSLDGLEIILAEDIPQAHKFALTPIKKNQKVIKYGNPIGSATQDISPGTWIHTHNLKTGLGDLLTYSYHPDLSTLPETPERFFSGFRRPDGSAGVRNEIWIIPTVGCMNSVAAAIERQAREFLVTGVDDVISFPHPYGCSQMGDDQEHTRTILADLVRHPNAGGVLVLGLGCENSNIDVLKEYIGKYDDNRVKFLVAQEVADETTESLRLLRELIAYAAGFQREKISSRELIIGTKCGGSDGLSGITANPTVGAFSDLLISKGGTTILTEVPEMFGAEALLMNRSRDTRVFNKIVDLINNFKQYFKAHNQTIYENPSPGNKKGGISTLEDKSLGCTQKSGTASIQDVLRYGEPVRQKGLNLLSAPGNDLVAATALAASGAQIVLFTTGRGTPFAAPVPTIKISSNTTLFNQKSNWIDFNCGTLTEGVSPEDLKNRLFDYVIEVASGRQVKSEIAGYHDMAIFKQGVTL